MAHLVLEIEGLDGDDSKTTDKAGSAGFTNILRKKTVKAGLAEYTDQRVFDLLREYLQPGSMTSARDVALKISSLLPEHIKYDNSPELFSLWQLCIEIVWQIPYNHPSMVKLVRFIQRLNDCSKTAPSIVLEDGFNYLDRLHILARQLRDFWIPPFMEGGSVNAEEVAKWTNFMAFDALLTSFGLVDGTDNGLLALKSAFEEKPYSSEEFNSRVLAASQWIVHAGQVMFRQTQVQGTSDPDLKEIWQPGPLYQGDSGYSLHRWHLWKDGFRNAAEKGEIGDEPRCWL